MTVLRRLVVTAMILAALLVIADRVVSRELEAGVARGVASADAVVSGADGEVGGVVVDVGGFPVLTQLLVGRLDELKVTIPGYQAQAGDVSVLITDIHADVRAVTTSEPYVAQSITASGAFSAESLTAAMNAAGVRGDVSIRPDGVSFSTTLLGREASGRLSIAIDRGGRALRLVAESVSIAGHKVPLQDYGLDALLTTSVAVDALPDGIAIQSITPGEGHLVATLVGTDVDLSAMMPHPSP